MPRSHTGSRRTSNRFRPTPQKSHRVVRRTPIDSPDGGTQIQTVTTTQQGRQRRTERRTGIPTGGSQTEVITESNPYRRYNISSLSPTRAAENASSSIGLLEAEFIAIELIIFIELFTKQDTYGNKIMSTMKRGMFTAILFFILALVASIGPGATKISKALGGLVFGAILLTSPVTSMLGELDQFFKADWIGTNEAGPVTSASSDNNSSNTGSSSSIVNNIVNALSKEGIQVPQASQQGGLAGIEAYVKNWKGDISQAAKNALESIIPGLKL